MKRIGLAVLVLLGVGGALYFLLSDPEVPPATPDVTEEETRPDQATGLRSEEKAPPATERQALADATQRPETASSETPSSTTIFVGRCVMKGTKEPVAGCQIRALNTERHALSGPDGQFSIEVTGLLNPFFAIVAGRHDLCGMENHAHPIPGQTKDLGEVPMTVGTSLSGAVLDAVKTTVADANITLAHRTIRRTSAGWTPHNIINLRTTSDGSFRTPCALWPGSYTVGCLVHPVVNPKTLDIGKQPPGHISVQVQRRNPQEMIAGRIYDSSGRPAAGIGVMILGAPLTPEIIAQRNKALANSPASFPANFRNKLRLPSPTARRSLGRARTDDNGAFFFIVKAANRQSNDVEGAWIETSQTEQYRRLTSHRIPWGSQNVQLTVTNHDAEASAAQVAVVDEEGAPIARFKATLRETAAKDAPYRFGMRPRKLGEGSTHPGGKIKLPSLDDGRYILRIVPENKLEFAELNLPIELPRDRDRELKCTLKKLLQLTVEVVDEQNRPVAASAVKFHGIPAEAATPTYFSRSGQTDARGRFTMTRPRELKSVKLSVTGSHLPATENIPLLGGDESKLRIQVSSGVRLRGRIVPLDHWKKLQEAKASLTFLSPSGGLQDFSTNRVSPAADGTFETKPLGTGSHRVILQISAARRSLQRIELRTLLVAAETEEVTLDVSEVQIGKLRGQLLTNGEPRSNHKFMMVYEGLRQPPENKAKPGETGWFPMGSLLVATDAEGKFSIENTPAGFYRVQSLMETSSRIRVAPGEREWVFKTQRQILSIQLTDTAGKPLAGIYQVETSQGPRTSDANGCLELTVKEDTAVQLFRLEKAGKRVTLGPFKIEKGAERTGVKVPWPK